MIGIWFTPGSLYIATRKFVTNWVLLSVCVNVRQSVSYEPIIRNNVAVCTAVVPDVRTALVSLDKLSRVPLIYIFLCHVLGSTTNISIARNLWVSGWERVKMLLAPQPFTINFPCFPVPYRQIRITSHVQRVIFLLFCFLQALFSRLDGYGCIVLIMDSALSMKLRAPFSIWVVHFWCSDQKSEWATLNFNSIDSFRVAATGKSVSFVWATLNFSMVGTSALVVLHYVGCTLQTLVSLFSIGSLFGSIIICWLPTYKSGEVGM